MEKTEERFKGQAAQVPLRLHRSTRSSGLPLPNLVLLEHAGILETVIRGFVSLMKVRQRRRRRREEIQKERIAYH